MGDNAWVPVQGSYQNKLACQDCGVFTEDWFIADNNYLRESRIYCGKCEEIRSEKFGCALLLDEGAMCDEGACGCGGTGVY